MAPLSEKEGVFACQRGYDLFTLQLAPSSGKLRALIVYHHGFGEHCTRHIRSLRHLAEQLQAMVVTYDVHGHGRSGPHIPKLRAYVASWRHLLDDLLDVVDKVAWPAAEERGVPKGKIFLLGHSMGGMTSALASLHRPKTFAGIMLSSPLVSVTPLQSWGEWAQILVLRLLNVFIPAKPLLKRRTVAAGMRNPESVLEVEADTLWYRDPIKVRTVVSCINATLVLQARAGELSVPLYLQQGTLDKTCSVISLRRMLPKFGSQDVTYHEVEGAFHDLLHDTETPDCLKRMVDFVNTHL